MKVNTTWIYSLETETDRLIQVTANTYNRFYLKNNFLILPCLIEGSASTVYLPNLNFHKYTSFVRKLSRINPTEIPVTDDQNLYRVAKNFLSESITKFDEERISNTKKSWLKKEKTFWKFLEQTFPQLANQTISLDIRPTNFGTVTSFSLPKTIGRNTKIVLYLRTDQSVAQIAEAVLSSLFSGWLKKDKLGWSENWLENEAVIDFLMTKTRLKDIFPEYQPTLKNLRQKQLGKLVLESQKYLKKLGIAVGDIFSLKDDCIFLDQKYTLTGLTEKEYKLLKYLIENKNQICSIDAIGDILWQNENENDFSPWAIAKQIERLRQKFQTHGISPALIQAQRGKGYLLKD